MAMPSFSFTARDPAGKRQSGLLNAPSQASAAAVLRERGWQILSLAPEPEGQSSASVLRASPGLLPIRSLDVELSLQQLATLIRSGVALLGALRLVAGNAERLRMRRVWERVVDRVESGASLKGALEEEACFTRMTVQLVGVGEQTGNLGPVLERAALALERRRALLGSLASALIYPGIVFCMALGIAAFMVLNLIPKLERFLSALGKKLPPMTQRLVDLSVWIRSDGLLAAAIFLGIAGGGVALCLWPPGRRWVDGALLRLPLVGPLCRTAGTALFARSFGILITSGITILEGLRVGETLLGNLRLREIVANARIRVMQGESLSRPLDEPHGFMPLLPRMVAVGESSGSLDTVLEEIARFYEAALERLIRRLTLLIEPAMILSVGFIVGYVYISFFVAMFAAAGPGNSVK
jgi:type II secretory pathway component PulF